MNFACWNCRGSAGKGFVSLIKDLCEEYNLSMLFLLETHSSGDRATNLVKRTGFQCSFVVDYIGQAGGIWCLWDPAVWSAQVLNCSAQHVHLQVSWKQGQHWLLTVIYASPRYQTRKQL